MTPAPWVRRLVPGASLFLLVSGFTWAANCDLNGDGVVNVVDVQLVTNMMLGTATCTANVVGAGVCNSAAITVLINAALGGPSYCHSVVLTWTASTSTGVTGYNVYRGGQTGGPYTIQNSSPVSGTIYYDTNVQSGQPYFYVVQSVAGSAVSANSAEASATVPTS